jgi:hypothetical protein
MCVTAQVARSEWFATIGFCGGPDKCERKNVQAIALVGDFNNWQARDSDWAVKNDYGTFALFLPDEGGKPQIPHRCTL